MDTSSGLCHEKSVISVPVRVRVSNFRSFFEKKKMVKMTNCNFFQQKNLAKFLAPVVKPIK